MAERSAMLLTKDELQELTGYKRPLDQCAWLRKRGWSFELNAANRPVVLRAHAEHQLGKPGSAAAGAGPNFAALRA